MGVFDFVKQKNRLTANFILIIYLYGPYPCLNVFWPAKHFCILVPFLDYCGLFIVAKRERRQGGCG